MPHNFSWIFEGRLAAMGRPGCGLELASQMMPPERRFLSWLQSTPRPFMERDRLADRISIQGMGERDRDRRMEELYRKFREVWGILESVREGFGKSGEPVDRFKLSPKPIEKDLRFVEKHGIDTIVSLTETPLDAEVLESFEFDVLHIPVPDRTAPTPDQLDQFVAFVDGKLNDNHGLLFHCLGGYGRTGTMAAVYLVHCGMDAREAVEGIREQRPGSIEEPEQEQAVLDFEERIR